MIKFKIKARGSKDGVIKKRSTTKRTSGNVPKFMDYFIQRIQWI